MTDLQQAAERVRRVRGDRKKALEQYCELCELRFSHRRVGAAVAIHYEDCELLACAYLDLRAEILLACLEESTYDGLHARIMTLHERGE
jgi:hypothetical protein